jgi:hypothetical protein
MAEGKEEAVGKVDHSGCSSPLAGGHANGRYCGGRHEDYSVCSLCLVACLSAKAKCLHSDLIIVGKTLLESEAKTG